MKHKLKICSRCGFERTIWKTLGRERYCKTCALFLFPYSKTKPRSDKKIKKDKGYSVLCAKFKETHPYCEVMLPECSKFTTDVHHTHFGKDKDKFYLIVSTWKAACRNCHHVIHDILSTEELIKLGLRTVD